MTKNTEYRTLDTTDKNEVRVGDKVRVEIEGEVSYVYSSDYIEVSTPDDTIGLNPTDPAQVITKIVDVPTKLGAVVLPYDTQAWHLYVLADDGHWTTPTGVRNAADAVHKRLQRGTHYVAFEGVES